MIRFLLVLSFAYLFLMGNPGQLSAQNQRKNPYKELAQAQNLFDRGIPYLNNSQYDSASYCFQGSIDLYHKAKNREGVLSSGIYLAIALKNQGKLTAFLKYEDAMESYLNESDSLFTQIKLSLGAAHFAAGNSLTALRYLKRSQHSFEDQKSSNFTFLLTIYRNQAQVYRKLGCPAYELDFYQKIEKLVKEEKVLISDEELLRLHLYTSKAYVDTQEPVAARQHLLSATQLLQKTGLFAEKDQQAEILSQIGNMYERLGDYKEASGVFRKKIQALKQNEQDYAPVFFRLAKLAFLAKRYPNALDSLNQVASLMEQDTASYSEQLAETYFLLGEIQRIQPPEQDQKSQAVFAANLSALEHYQKVLAIWVTGYEGNSVNKIPDLDKIPQTKMAHDLLWAYAEALNNQLPFLANDLNFQKKRCLATYQKAMEMGDLMRNNNRIEEIELIPLDSLAKRYEKAIGVALDLFKTEKDDRYLGIAFQFQQRKKSSEIRELFWEYFRKNGYAWSLDEQTERRDFIVRIEENEAKLSLLKNKEERQLLEGLIEGLRDEYRSFMSSFAYAHPAFFELKNQKDYTDIAELREYLQPEEVLLSFFQGERVSYMFSLSKDSMGVEEIKTVTLQTGLHRFLEQVSSPNSLPENYTHRAFDLYQKLIAPSLPDTLNSLIIVPDGLLHYVPVEALISSNSQTEGFATLDYLIKKYPIRYLNHSAKLLPSPYSTPSRDDQNRYAAFFPSYAEEAFEWLDSLHMSPAQQVKVSLPFMPPLKNQEKELKKRLALMKGDAFMSKKTTKHNFGRYGPRYYSIDIAGYALSTDYQPIHSGLAFSNHREEENFLDAYEIAQNLYPNDLITLPNHSTLGEKINGRGIQSLLGAFHLSHSQNITLSLWQVMGSSNQELLSHFYKNLYAGSGKAHALQEAKLSFLSEKGSSQHPYYWSSMVLYGDNIELKGEERPWWSYGALFFALFMVMLILFGFRRKRRRR